MKAVLPGAGRRRSAALWEGGFDMTPEESETSERRSRAERKLQERDASIVAAIESWTRVGPIVRFGCALVTVLVLAGAVGIVVAIWRVALSLGR